MARELVVEVITPERVVFSGKATLVVVPGISGELGFQPMHSPLASLLTIGEVRLTFADNTREFIAISEGYVKVLEDKVTVMTETAELSYEIDEKRAREELNRAKARLSEGTGDQIELLKAQLAYKRAETLLKVAEKKTKK